MEKASFTLSHLEQLSRYSRYCSCAFLRAGKVTYRVLRRLESHMKLTEKSVAVVANATSLLPNGTHSGSFDFAECGC